MYRSKFEGENYNTINGILRRYESGEYKFDDIVSTIGRIVEKRLFGKIGMYTLRSKNEDIQVQIAYDGESDLPEFKKKIKGLNRGDVIGITGFICMPREMLTIKTLDINKCKILTPCQKMLTRNTDNKELSLITKVNNRHIDLVVDKTSCERFIKRSKITSAIRRYLEDRNYLEVETPILSRNVGGANAKPFISKHNELDIDVYMRVAPELYLKTLIVGGMEKVFEIGKQFRNESIDTTHNPEFTSLEFYAMNHDYKDLMNICQEMLRDICEKIDYDGKIDFQSDFRRIDILPYLEEKTGISLCNQDLSTDEVRYDLIDYMEENEIQLPQAKTNAKLLDKLISHIIEPECIQPTFLINHPSIMCTLAKRHNDNEYITERFELFVNGYEIANAYSELTDPVDQKERFIESKKDGDKYNDDEIVDGNDKNFIEALEFGLPPTGGFGMGIDRLTMILTETDNIKDVIYFPMNNS